MSSLFFKFFLFFWKILHACGFFDFIYLLPPYIVYTLSVFFILILYFSYLYYKIITSTTNLIRFRRIDMNQINPYRRNCEVMRKFFAKPIFLITGIVFSICVIVNLILGLLIKQNIYFDFMTVASCIAFFMFYFTARSKKESVSFRVPTVMLDIVSIDRKSTRLNSSHAT